MVGNLIANFPSSLEIVRKSGAKLSTIGRTAQPGVMTLISGLSPKFPHRLLTFFSYHFDIQRK